MYQFLSVVFEDERRIGAKGRQVLRHSTERFGLAEADAMLKVSRWMLFGAPPFVRRIAGP
jgi:hypothetical protein